MGNLLFINNTEKALIERLCRNDEVAQRQLFDRYEKKLLAVCFRYLRNETLDALNRSFLKIFKKIHQYKSEAKFETWVQRITINTCLDCIKSQKKYKQNFIQVNEFDLYGEPDAQHNDLNGWLEAATAIPAEVLTLI
jgi:RNA polymerase sigma factor (sigma-70 family)